VILQYFQQERYLTWSTTVNIQSVVPDIPPEMALLLLAASAFLGILEHAQNPRDCRGTSLAF
jgi:hypothetical protein